METEEDNVLYQTPAKALAFIDRLERKEDDPGYVIQEFRYINRLELKTSAS